MDFYTYPKIIEINQKSEDRQNKISIHFRNFISNDLLNYFVKKITTYNFPDCECFGN